MRFLAGLFTACLALAVAGTAQATPGWYEVTFTGADMWNYSVDNASQTAVQQSAPHRYATYDVNGARTVVATTWGIAPPGIPAGGGANFGAWATANTGYVIDQFNLYGIGNIGASWGEKYESVGTAHPDHGMSSWEQILAPAGWTDGIVQGGDSWSFDETHAFPVWRVGTGTALTQLNKNDPQFVWTFDVLIANPETAFESNGMLKVFWGGSHDDFSDVAGIMQLEARPIPEPLTMAGLMLGIGSLVGYVRKRRKA